MWFKELTGFKEVSADQVRANIYIAGQNLISKINRKSYQYGRLEIPTLQSLKEQAPKLESYNSKITVSEIVKHVQILYCDPANVDALFQAASQFNLLEMFSPDITPEHGVDIYELDFTQGPACAVACGAGTIYRNYFVPVDGQIGQTKDHQIDCLDLIGKELNNEALQLWHMKNGYALLNRQGMLTINAHLSQLTNQEREHLQIKTKNWLTMGNANYFV